MARIKIGMPDLFPFTTTIPVRITDINYGGHVGNDTILSIIHEIRLQFFAKYKFTEMNFGGVGLIMSDVAIEFKNQVYYGDTIKASATAAEFSRVSFDIIYKLEKEDNKGKLIPVAFAKTAMVSFDYALKKVVTIPENARVALLKN